MSRIDRDAPDPRLLTHALEKLRARDGITADRLLASQSLDATTLLGLRAVARYCEMTKLDPPEAAVEVVKGCVRELLPASHRVVADAVLGLGTFTDRYEASNVDPKVVKTLSVGYLGRRREMLLLHWRALHDALGLACPEPPSDRALRGTVEPAVLAGLADQLVRREVYSIGTANAPVPAGPDQPPKKAPGTVVVLGGAVMDAKFRTRELPPRGTSVDAFSFQLVPGGKGLNQAIAAARLGLDTSLVAAVAGDRFGDEIVERLEEAGVDTSLIKRVDDARTSFTAVIEFELGDSAALTWRNQNVRLGARDLEAVADRLVDCDALLLTFELPRSTLEFALRLVSDRDQPKPTVIVTPGQPYDTAISGQSLAAIDYLVAHAWELGQYKPADEDLFDLDVAARVLLTQGVETLCVPGSGGCTVYSRLLGSFPVPTVPSQYKEASIARDAFCAALAAQLIDNGKRFSEEVALWATAAMAAAKADHPAPNPMPDRRRVQQLLEHSRYVVNPRPQVNGEAGE
jgi:ribokinase